MTELLPRLKQPWLIALLILISRGGLHAAEFSLEPKAGIVFGRAREIVYPVGYNTDNPYLSELRWDIMPAAMLGFGADVTMKKGLELRLDFQGALPLSSGEMYDYDWIYLNRDDWTHRSIHDVGLNSAFIVDLSIAGPLVQRRGWDLLLSLGYHLDWWSWHDSVQEYLYTSDGGGGILDTPTDYTGGDPFRDFPANGDGSPGISYEVAYHIPYVGLESRFFGEHVNGELGFNIGPVIALDHDHHIARGLHFYDSGIGGPWMGLEGRLSVLTGTVGEWFLESELVWFPEFSGRVDQYDEYGNYMGSTSGGAGFQFWRFGLNLGYSFFL